MTRDGAVSVNLITGKTTYPSDRTPEQDYSTSGDAVGAAGKVVDRAELHQEQAAAKKKRRQQRRAYWEGEAAASRPSSRLQFPEANRATPELQGAIRKSDKAAARLDAALARGELPDFLREREVFIDEFDTFNAPKKRLMGAMLAADALALVTE